MVLWAAIIVTLIVCLIVGLTLNYQQEFIVGTAYLILLVSLAIFYRVLRRIKSREIEDLSGELEALQRENELLRRRLGYSPTEPIDIDDSDLLNEPKEEQ